VDEPLIVSVKVDHDEYSGSLRGSAVEILTLAEARLRYAKGLMIRLSEIESPKTQESKNKDFMDERLARNEEDLIEKLKVALAPVDQIHKSLRVTLSLTRGYEACELSLSDRFRVQPDEETMKKIRHLLVGVADVLLDYR
jgi:hypothetical protein